jgi:hypothetical protein
VNKKKDVRKHILETPFEKSQGAIMNHNQVATLNFHALKNHQVQAD